LGTCCTGPAAVAARGPSPGTTSTASNAPASPAPVSALRSIRVLRASCRLLSSDRVSSPPTMPLTVLRARSISSVAARTLTSRIRSVIWLVRTKPSTKMTASDSPSVSTTTRNCRERRHARPIARLSAANPRSNGAERRWMRRLELKITATAQRSISGPPPRVEESGPPPSGEESRPPPSGEESRRSGLVSHSSNGQHHLRVLRVFLDLGPQTLDMHVHQTGVRGVPVSPHLFKQHITSKHLPWFACQRHQQVELQRCQGNLLTLPGDLVGGYVDVDVGDRQHLGWLILVAAQPGAHAGNELLGLERLHDV